MTCEFLANSRGISLIAVMIASLSLITPSWAKGNHAMDGKESKPMQTSSGSRMVAPALEKYAQGPLLNCGDAPGSRRGTGVSLRSSL